MHTTRHLLTAVAALTLSAGAFAAPDHSEIQARYERERAVCLSGQSNQDRATCLAEAVSARAEALRGRLEVGAPDYQRNALERCKAFTGEDARECRARIEGAGTISGSVAEGGIFRELITIEPAEQPAK